MTKHSRHIPTQELKVLLARSGNQCAYPNCIHPIFDNNNLFIAQLCHIEAISPLGQRYNPEKPQEEVNSYENLLFLCYRHHKETDNVSLFSVEKLKNIKKNHEQYFKEKIYKFSDEVLLQLAKEINIYWESIYNIQLNSEIPEITVSINTDADILTLISDIKGYLESLREVNYVLVEELKDEQFEMVCLALPNCLTMLQVLISQLEIKYIEEKTLANEGQENLKVKLNTLRDEFIDIVKWSGLH